MTTQHIAPPVPAQQTLALINANIASSVRLLNDFSLKTERRLAEVGAVHAMGTLSMLQNVQRSCRKHISPFHIAARLPAREDARRSRSESSRRSWHLCIPQRGDRKAAVGTAGVQEAS